MQEVVEDERGHRAVDEEVEPFDDAAAEAAEEDAEVDLLRDFSRGG